MRSGMSTFPRPFPDDVRFANRIPSLLANMETENPASPPSTAASPSLSKVAPDSSNGDDKKETE